MAWNSKYKTIIYTAILTTPFIGLFGITPIIMPIIMDHTPGHQHMISQGVGFMTEHVGPENGLKEFHYTENSFRQPNSLIPFLVVTLQVALIWLQNILLLIYGSYLFSKLRFGRTARFVASYCISAIIVEFERTTISQSFFFAPANDTFNYLMPVISGFATNTIVLIIMELLLIRHSETQMKIENAELKMQHIQAQHEKLLNQLQPHFLFNSLNALKTLMKRDTYEAEEYLVKLSDFLRFSLSHNEQTIVLLSEELRFSLTYLEMQKTRFSNSFFYKIDISEEIRVTKKLPVFSLQLLLENCIKHNTFTEEAPLSICIYCKDDFLIVSNNIQLRNQTENPSGVGLANLSQRYKYLAGEEVKIEQTNSHFTVFLKLL